MAKLLSEIGETGTVKNWKTGTVGLFYAIDSAFAVLAVVSSIMLSIMIGFNRVFVIAIVLYVLIAALFMVWELTVKE